MQVGNKTFDRFVFVLNSNVELCSFENNVSFGDEVIFKLVSNCFVAFHFLFAETKRCYYVICLVAHSIYKRVDLFGFLFLVEFCRNSESLKATNPSGPLRGFKAKFRRRCHLICCETSRGINLVWFCHI